MWARSSLKCHAQADRFINLAIIVIKRHSLSLSLSLSHLAGVQSNKLKFARMLPNPHAEGIRFAEEGAADIENEIARARDVSAMCYACRVADVQGKLGQTRLAGQSRYQASEPIPDQEGGGGD